MGGKILPRSLNRKKTPPFAKGAEGIKKAFKPPKKCSRSYSLRRFLRMANGETSERPHLDNNWLSFKPASP